jgi:hypothetical protein
MLGRELHIARNNYSKSTRWTHIADEGTQFELEILSPETSPGSDSKRTNLARDEAQTSKDPRRCAFDPRTRTNLAGISEMAGIVMQTSIAVRSVRVFWLICATIFLIESWLWDQIGYFVRSLVALLPLEPVKQYILRLLMKLPPWPAFLIFISPLIVVEPLNFFGVWAFVHRHFLVSISAFLCAKVVGIGAMAFLFDTLRETLLSMKWFLAFFLWVSRVRQRANELLDPHRARVRALVIQAKHHLGGASGINQHSGLARRLVRLRLRFRRATRAYVALNQKV